MSDSPHRLVGDNRALYVIGCHGLDSHPSIDLILILERPHNWSHSLFCHTVLLLLSLKPSYPTGPYLAGGGVQGAAAPGNGGKVPFLRAGALVLMPNPHYQQGALLNLGPPPAVLGCVRPCTMLPLVQKMCDSAYLQTSVRLARDSLMWGTISLAYIISRALRYDRVYSDIHGLTKL